MLPTYGGIVYNVSVGDRAFGWAADCIHPGVSIGQADDNQNRGLNVFACAGNRARVMAGGAAGTTGVVTGKSGRFSEQVIVHLPREARTRMAVGDQVLIRAEGVGLSLTDHPGVSLKGISPGLLAALPAREEEGHVAFGVTAQIPAHLVGAGLGLTSEGGSLHMQSTDRELLAELGLDQLHLACWLRPRHRRPHDSPHGRTREFRCCRHQPCATARTGGLTLCICESWRTEA